MRREAEQEAFLEENLSKYTLVWCFFVVLFWWGFFVFWPKLDQNFEMLPGDALPQRHVQIQSSMQGT